MHVIVIIVLILAVLLVIFTLQNSMVITLKIFFWEISNAPLVLVLICCVLLGYIVATIYFYPKLWKVKREYSQLIKFNKELKELHDLDHSGQNREEENNPEGIELDDEDDDSYFKD